MARRLVPFDPYAERGVDTFELPQRLSSDTLRSWRTSLEEIVRLRHPSDSAAIDLIMGIDLNSIVNGFWRSE